MAPKEFRIRKVLVIPHLLCALLASALLGISWCQGEPPARLVLPVSFTLLFTFLAVNILVRRLRIDEKSVSQRRLWGIKTIPFDDINRFDATQLRNRVFFALSTADSYLIFTNAYDDLGDILKTLMERIPPHKVGAEIPPLADLPPLRQANVIPLWLMVAILGAAIGLQLHPLLP